MHDRDSIINDLNVAKLILCNPHMLTPEMCIRIGQAVTNALALLKDYKNEYEKGFNDAMWSKQELMYEGVDGKWYKKDW